MLSRPTYRRAGSLILLCHLANLAKLSNQPGVDLARLVNAILQAVIAAVHALGYALDGFVVHAVIGNGKQSILIEKPQRSLKGIFFSTKSGSVITFGTPMSDANAR